MFETVSPEVFIRRNRRVFYETLPISIAVHVLAVGWLLGSTFMHTRFPDDPPHLAFAYRIAMEPPPPPPPPPPRATRQEPEGKVELPLDKIVAPTVIPDTIPVLEPVPIVAAEIAPLAPVAGAVDGGTEGGVAGGDPNAGVVGGTLGGEPRGVLGGLLLGDGRVHFARNKPLPLFVEHQEYPEYPEGARQNGFEDSCTVRYTIDTRGHVKELIVLDHAERKIFEEAALSAIKGWRFRPLVVDGEAREAVHELTVFFRLK